MKKIFPLMILFFALFSLCFSQEFEKKCMLSVMQLENIENDSTGSAVIVSSKEIGDGLFLNIIFSAEHVIVDPKNMNACSLKINNQFIENDEKFKIHLICSDKDNDLAAAMFLSNKKMHTADVDYNAIPNMHEKVCIVGCGLGESLRYSEGIVTSLKPSKEKYNEIRTNVYVVPGDSGCPLYLKDKVIGITSSIRAFSSGGVRYIANSISTFKPIKLFVPIFKSEKYNFVVNEKTKYPKVIVDWLWFTNTDLLANN